MKAANQAEGIDELCWRSSIGGLCQGCSQKEETMEVEPKMKKVRQPKLRANVQLL